MWVIEEDKSIFGGKGRVVMKRIFLSIFIFGVVLSSTFVCLAAPEKGVGEVSIEKRMSIIKRLVDDAATFFKKHRIDDSCRAFEQDEKWNKKGLAIFVFGGDGVCLLHGNDRYIVWKNVNKLIKNVLLAEGEKSASFIDNMLEVGGTGGWISYEWNRATKHSYVKTVTKAGKTYIIGSGLYPGSSKFNIKHLVKKAIDYAEDNGAISVFNKINNPIGDLVKGDLFLWAYDLEGNCFAHGRNFAMVGQNRINWQDSRGKFRNKIMIDLIKKSGFGWISYDEHGIEKRAYVESFIDPRSQKSYIIGGGFYPHINENSVKTFVTRAISHLKANGSAIAFRDFSSRAGGFIEGPLTIAVYDLEGKVFSDAESPIFIGQNLIGVRDAEGKFVTKEIIELAKSVGYGWITHVDKGSYKSVYIEKVEIPDGKFIVGSGYWPSSKTHTARLFAAKAVDYLERNPLSDALGKFTSRDSEFLQGDLFISVYTEAGICLCKGLNLDHVWFDEKNILDKRGYPLINRLIDKARAGGGWIEYPVDDGVKRSYVSLVRKTVKTVPTKKSKKQMSRESYIVSVGYHL